MKKPEFEWTDGRTFARWIRAAWPLPLMLLLATRAAAQVQVPSELSLDQAIAMALRANPGHLQLLNDVEVADAQVQARYGAFFPTVSLGAGFNSTYREAQSTTGPFGEPLSQPQAVISKTSGASQSISLGSITLFDGGTQFRNLSTAKIERTAVEARIAEGANTLRANVTRSYYQIVMAEQRLELERQLLVFATERLQLVQRQFEIAAARQTDLLGARLEIAQREQAVADAEYEIRSLRLGLNQLLGISGEPSIRLVSDFPTVIDAATLNADALVARAVQSHPNVLLSAVSVEIAENQLSNQRTSRLPRLSLNLPNYTWGAQHTGLFDAWGRFGAPNNSFSFGISASLPVFTGFSKSAEIKQSLAAADDARERARETRLQVETEVRTAIIQLERAHRGLLLAQLQAEISQERLELAQQEYGAGTIAFTALQQIIESNDQTQRSVLNAQFNFLNARVVLEQRLGSPLAEGG